MNDKPHIIKPREGNSWNGWCVHYAGFMEPNASLKRKTHCNAGVEYASVEKKVEFTYSHGKDTHRYSKHSAHPCFKAEHGLTDGCSKCRFPTPEEIKAHDEECTGHVAKMFKARAAILDELKRRALAGDAKVKPLDPNCKHRWHGTPSHYYSGSGEMACPVCNGGKLQYSRSGYNGHVHARCSTADCVAWME